jgi:hydroxymethylbilane synthase
MVVCRLGDEYAFKACSYFNDEQTALCTKAEKDFLRTLMGGLLYSYKCIGRNKK